MAAEEWGVLTTAELRGCGLTASAIATRARRGSLHSMHRGVYAVGHPNPPWEGRLLGAVKALGPMALLSHYSAAELWEMVERIEGRFPDVTVNARGSRAHRGIRIHRSLTLTDHDRRVHYAIPVTSPARTLLDLASVLEAPRVRAALRRALGRKRISLRQLGVTLDRYPRGRGAAILRNAVALGAAPTNSDKESDVLDLISEAGFAFPKINQPLVIGGRRVVPDFRWPHQRLILEIDSTAWHENPLARADDRERQALLEAHGETVLRVHWRDAILSPSKLTARLRAAGAPLRDHRRVHGDNRQ